MPLSRSMLRLPLLLLVLHLAGCAALRAPERAGLDVVVSAAELAERLDDPALVLLHVGRERASYEAGHIPGARFLPFSAVAVEREGRLNALPSPDAFREAMEAAGVSDESRVVLYGDLDGLAAARAFFALDAYGHARTAVLDGGLAAWRASGGVVTAEEPEPRRGALTPRLRPELVVTAAEVEARRGDAVLVDARPPAQYSGEDAGGDVDRPGHIPGAVNRFWKEDVREDGTLRPEAELRAHYAARGVLPGWEAIAYCRTGVQASHTYLVLRHLGLAPRLYDDSYLDWSNRTEYPVEGGE